MTSNLGTRDITKGSARLLGPCRHPQRLRPHEEQGGPTSSSTLPFRVPQPRRRHHRLPAADRRPRSSPSSTSRSRSSTSGSRTRTWASSLPWAEEPVGQEGRRPRSRARPLRRTIEREIEDVLSEKILYGELKAGELVLVAGVTEDEGGRALRSPSLGIPTRAASSSRSWRPSGTQPTPAETSGMVPVATTRHTRPERPEPLGFRRCSASVRTGPGTPRVPGRSGRVCRVVTTRHTAGLSRRRRSPRRSPRPGARCCPGGVCRRR